MATLSAMVHDPAIRQFRARLRVTGKLPKVVLVACMRKLLTILMRWSATALRGIRPGMLSPPMPLDNEHSCSSTAASSIWRRSM
jgi:hypothetical protein